MKDHTQVKKAVIAAAGYGTRFIPATKNLPKEMLPIIDKPIIYYLVEEAVNSGITDIIIVCREGQSALEDFFDNNYALEIALEKSGKTELLEEIRRIPQMANFAYVRQKKSLPYGNGSPLLAAKDLIDDDESIIYMFGDDMTLSKVPVTQQLIDAYKTHSPKAVIAVQEVPWEEVHKYGVITYKKDAEYQYEIEGIVEKPKREEAPSNMAQFGRFLLTHDVLERAKTTQTGKGGELWLADILGNMAKDGEKIIAPPIEGEWLTTGDPLNYLKATLKYAMLRDDLKDDLKKFITEEIKQK